MSIIIDGMDQDKTNVPHLISTPKALSGAYTLETHVTGVRVHGRCTMMFIDCQQFPHDSNLTIELLTQVFLKYKVKNYTLRFCTVIEQVKCVSVNQFCHTLCNRTACLRCCTCKWTTPAETIRISLLSRLLHCWFNWEYFERSVPCQK